MFLGLLDPDPNLLVRGMDPKPDRPPDLDPCITKQKSKKNLDPYWYCFVTFFLLFIFKNDVPVQVPSKSNKKKTLEKFSFLLASWEGQ